MTNAWDIMDSEETISVKGKKFRIAVERCSGRIAKVSIKNDTILMKFPVRISQSETARIYSNFREWAVKRLMKIDLSELEPKPKYIEFHDGQQLEIFYRSFRIGIRRTSSNIPKGRIYASGDMLITLPEDMPRDKSSMAVYMAVRRLLSKSISADLLMHVKGLNARHFNHDLNKVTIRDQATRWGSCSRTTGNINLNFRLLMAPDRVRDYVIIHELAHLKHPNHSKRFWKLVESADPDFKERRKWLRLNGSRLGMQDTPEPSAIAERQKMPQ